MSVPIGGWRSFKLDEGRVQTVLPLPDNKIAIQTDTHLILLD